MVVCLYQWNVIVNSFLSMCEQGSSVYSACSIPLLQNKLNWVAYVQEMCDLFLAVFDEILYVRTYSFVSEKL